MELVKQPADAGADGFGSAHGRLTQQMLQFGKDLLDGIEIGTVRGQEQEPGPDTPDRFADSLPLMAAEVIHDHDIAGFEGWQKEALHIGQEADSIDRAVELARRIDAVTAQRGEESQRAPTAVRRLADQA